MRKTLNDLLEDWSVMAPSNGNTLRGLQVGLPSVTQKASWRISLTKKTPFVFGCQSLTEW